MERPAAVQQFQVAVRELPRLFALAGARDVIERLEHGLDVAHDQPDDALGVGNSVFAVAAAPAAFDHPVQIFILKPADQALRLQIGDHHVGPIGVALRHLQQREQVFGLVVRGERSVYERRQQ